MRKKDMPEYNIWKHMMYRCYAPHTDNYRYYGGRGIRVSARWHTFENFFSDMGTRPDGPYQLDRINNDGDYGPENCRWTTKTENMRNTSFNTPYEAFGEVKCLVEWSEDIRCISSYSTMRRRIYRGWSLEDAMTVPARNMK